MTTDDDAGFARQTEPFRGELTAHCYRMLGSVADAEDVVQETYLRAWRAWDRYDAARASVRTWLYRIATNACLTALRSGSRRVLPSGLVAETDPRSPFELGEVPWLQPIPDDRVPGVDPGGLRLAFVAALQHLSARQRAVLILRDVLDFSAAETAEIIDASVTSVNSALLRARASVAKADETRLREPAEREQRAWVEQYTTAFVAADVEALKRLLAADVVMEMPPMTNWFTGPDNYAVFMTWVFEANGTDWRTVPVRANGQPGFAAYVRRDGRYQRHSLQVLTLSEEGVARNSVFTEAEILDAFGLAAHLDPDDVLDEGPFFHGTKADLRVGDLLTAGFRSNYRPEVVMNHIYFTALVDGAGLAAELAAGDAPPRVYAVEPTGPFENDPNVTDKKFPGNPTRSYRSRAPLRVTGEITDWTRLTPEALQAWRDRLAVLREEERGEIIN